MRRLPSITSLWLLLAAFCLLRTTRGQSFLLRFPQPSLDRWMYPYNASPGTRPSAPVFGTIGDAAGVDSRHGQFLLGFDSPAEAPAGRGAANYLIRRASLTATISRDLAFRHDPTQDAHTTYFGTNTPGLTPDSDAGRPIELFGAGFRNGYGAATFAEDGPFGGAAAGGRNAFAAGYDTHGALVDVSNNVGKTNASFPPFEAHPFAIGRCEGVAAGELVPAGTTVRFDMNLADPLVRQYLQEGLHGGRLRFVIASLHVSEFGGAPGWPDFFTRDNVLGQPPTLEIEGTAVRELDEDKDGLPDDWERFYFGGLQFSGGEDPDHDGMANSDEWEAGTDPSDQASLLRLSIESSGPGVTSVVRFSYAASHRHELESSRDLKTWEPVVNPALIHYSPIGTVSWRDPNTTTNGNSAARFLRVRVRAAP